MYNIVGEISASPHVSLIVKVKTKITIFVLGKYLGREERLFGWLFWFDLLLYIVFVLCFCLYVQFQNCLCSLPPSLRVSQFEQPQRKRFWTLFFYRAKDMIV